ncbi:orexin receptor type 2-like [Saccoglossus kowalevskii]|uniref:Substance-P receptor-like n=1 Tax=Saccoglossus kowalevskii TaxID=10224 RepID=A0ABM0MU28_SACKO|nr:PREDICTED: substance-P receptor-like [Saccoglossus kowalevskii]
MTGNQTDSSVTSSSEYKLAILYAIVGTIGLLGNMFVCYVFYRIRRLRSITNLFIINQSVIDMISSLIFLILKLGPIKLPSKGISGSLFCKFWYSEYLMWSLFLASTANLCVVTLERYFAICHPVFHRNKFNKKAAKIIIAIVWLYGFPIELLWGLPFHHSGEHCAIKYISREFSLIVGVLFFCIAWFFPLVLMVVCYVQIIKRLSGNKLNPSDNADRHSSNNNSTFRRAQRNVVKTLFIVSMTYALCWGPNEIALLHFNMGGYLDFSSDYYFFSVVLVFCNPCINPFIYVFQYHQFRDKIPIAFGCKKASTTDERTGTVTGSEMHTDA